MKEAPFTFIKCVGLFGEPKSKYVTERCSCYSYHLGNYQRSVICVPRTTEEKMCVLLCHSFASPLDFVLLRDQIYSCLCITLDGFSLVGKCAHPPFLTAPSVCLSVTWEGTKTCLSSEANVGLCRKDSDHGT